MAAAVGVTRIVQIGCDLPGARWAVETAAGIRPAGRRGGAAPQRGAPPAGGGAARRGAGARSSSWPAAATGCARWGRPGWTTSARPEEGRAAQHESFRAHIALAKALDKTLVIHDRDAHDDVLRIIDEVGRARALGDALLLRRRAVRPGLPRPGRLPVLRRHRHLQERRALRGALRMAPLDRILVETDAPYLTPTPHRGRPNASYLVPLTVRSMAQTREADLDDALRGPRGATPRPPSAVPGAESPARV